MTARTTSLDALDAMLRGTWAGAGPWSSSAEGEAPLLLVDLDGSEVAPVAIHAGLPVVVAGMTSRPDPETHPARVACDVVLRHGDAALEAIAATVSARPLASVSLALVLRGSESRSVDDGLLVESAAYSALQGGPELAAWLGTRSRRPRSGDEGDSVSLERSGDRLDITLTRPHVRNALDSAMRDALTDAFRLVAMDPSIAEVHLRGAGASFCAGGDLDEFGSFPDPATAHLVRLEQSAGRALHVVADRVTAHLHGACIGSGIEIPAFAARVLADPDSTIALPELSLGLIPGAGGTVSIPRRVGRHRTALLGLSGAAIDAGTALAWGLVDAIA